jgi:hypothetical protein
VVNQLAVSILTAQLKLHILIELDEEKESWSAFLGFFGSWIADWPIHSLNSSRFYVTSSGDVGQGRPGVQIGDSIYLVGDSWSSMVLRERGEYAEFRGETYLDSLYEGTPIGPGLKGDGITFKRGTMDHLDKLISGLQKKTFEKSPFLRFYDLNKDKIVQLSII